MGSPYIYFGSRFHLCPLSLILQQSEEFRVKVRPNLVSRVPGSANFVVNRPLPKVYFILFNLKVRIMFVAVQL